MRHGSQSRGSAASNQHEAEQRLGTHLRVLDGAGHLLPEELSERVAALVAEFTDAHGRH